MLPAVEEALPLTAPLMQTVFERMQEEEQVELPVTHYFSEGLYGRQLDIPAGMAFVGAEHRQDHLLVFLKGRLTVWSDAGKWEIVAPCVIQSKAGTQRVGIAHEDSSMLTVHATRLTELDALTQALVVPQGLLLTGDNACLGQSPQVLPSAS